MWDINIFAGEGGGAAAVEHKPSKTEQEIKQCKDINQHPSLLPSIIKATSTISSPTTSFAISSV